MSAPEAHQQPSGQPAPAQANGDQANPDDTLAQSNTTSTQKNIATRKSLGETMVNSDDVGSDIKRVAESGGDADLKRVLRAAARVGHNNETMVPRESLISYLEDNIKRRNDCLSIPFIILYFCAFTASIIVHEKVADCSQVQREMVGMLEGTGYEGYATWIHPVSGHKDINDIDVKEDIYTYLQDAVFPLFIMPLGTEAEHVNRVLSYNQLIGGIRLQQVRRKKVDCAGEYPNMGPLDEEGVNPLLSGVWCYPEGSVSEDCYGPEPRLEGFCPEPEMGSTRAIGAGPGGSRLLADGARGRRLSAAAHAAKSKMGKGTSIKQFSADGSIYNVNIYEHEGLQQALAWNKALADNAWIDPATTWMGIQLFVLNPDLGIFCKVTVNIFFLASGELVPYAEAFTFPAEPYANKLLFIADGLWAIFWLQLASACFWKLVKGSAKWKDYLCDFWVWVDWFTLAGGFVVMILWIVYCDKLDVVRNAAMDIVLKRPASGLELDHANHTSPHVMEYINANRRLEKDLFDFTVFLEWFRRNVGYYTILIMVRFFKAFSAQPRLAVVTETIFACTTDLVHFLIVFFAVFFAFTVAAMFLFGHRMIQFSDPVFAFQEALLTLFGAFDWDELSEENPTLTMVLWFAPFVILLLLMILNMALAIIMDVYGVAKNNAAFSDTLWAQTWMMIKEWKNRNDIVSMERLLAAVEMLKAEYVGTSVLTEIVPDISPSQATELIQHIEAAEVNDEEQNLSVSDACKLVVSIKNSVVVMAHQINQILEAQEQSKDIAAKAKKNSALLGVPWDPSMPEPQVRLDAQSNARIQQVEARLDVLESFLNESMTYIVFRAKEVRNRFKDMEDELRKQRDAVTDGNGVALKDADRGGNNNNPSQSFAA